MDKISIIIVSWRVKDLLKSCLASIESCRKDFDLEVFVVDNDSRDGTPEMVSDEFTWVKIIKLDGNIGFARANNIALQQATGDYILLLNPDTEITSSTLFGSIDFMKRQPDCGALGPKMLYPDGKLQPSVRRLPTVWPILLMLLKLPKIFPNLKAIDKYLARDFDYEREQMAEQIMGAYMFLPRRTLEKVGFLDERFFTWFEEVDYCRRIKAAGLEVWYSPSISIIHHGGRSFAQQAAVSKQKIFFMSALRYFLKYVGRNN